MVSFSVGGQGSDCASTEPSNEYSFTSLAGEYQPRYEQLIPNPAEAAPSKLQHPEYDTVRFVHRSEPVYYEDVGHVHDAPVPVDKVGPTAEPTTNAAAATNELSAAFAQRTGGRFASALFLSYRQATSRSLELVGVAFATPLGPGRGWIISNATIFSSYRFYFGDAHLHARILQHAFIAFIRILTFAISCQFSDVGWMQPDMYILTTNLYVTQQERTLKGTGSSIG
jgi:hypothetical protein